MLKKAIKYVLRLFKERNTIIALAKREILSRNSGTIFRSCWEIIPPALTLLVFWFIFSVGFKAKGPKDAPFILYFLTGQLPWLFFSECLTRGTQGIVAHSFLIKKMIFPSDVLPFVYVLSCALSHGLLLIIGLVILMYNGILVSWHWVQIFYYFITLCALLICLQWILSAIYVFNRDISQGLGIVLNLLFWLTPIVWVEDSLIPSEYQWVIQINPLAYIIDGYRGALLYQTSILSNASRGIYVWIIIICLFYVSSNIFRRLKPHFGDVL